MAGILANIAPESIMQHRDEVKTPRFGMEIALTRFCI